MKKLFNEFKEFAVKGNMIDIAIGVIIGASFNKVVDVFVKDIVMPPLSLLTGGINFAEKKIVLKEAVVTAESQTSEIAIGYGKFIEASLDFLIIAITVFIVIKVMNKLRAKAEDITNNSIATPKNIELLSDLKNLISQQNDLIKKDK